MRPPRTPRGGSLRRGRAERPGATVHRLAAVRRLVVALVLTAAGPALAAATPIGLRLHATTAWTDNLFQSASQRSDRVQQVSFDLDVGHAALGGWYTGRVDLYGDYGDLFTQTHSLGIGTRRTGPQRQQLSASLTASLREGRDTYDYRDYRQLRGTLAARRYLRPTLMLRGGASLGLRGYLHAGDFSYAEPAAWVQLSRFLPTRTTLIAGADLGVKAYLRAAGDTTRTWSRTSGEDAQALASVWLKAAQSLAPRTGLQLRFGWQTLWQGQPRYSQPEDYDPLGELFDDGYSHSGSDWRLTLKHQGGRYQAQLSAWTDGRRYDGRPALDLAGDPVGETRRDRRTGARLGLSHDLSVPAPAHDASVRLDVTMLSVSSNDPYYDASSRWLSLSLELGL